MLFRYRSTALACGLLAVLLLACEGPFDPAGSEYEVGFVRYGVLHVTDLQGSRVSPVVKSGLSSLDPSWSPDGRFVAVTRQSEVSLKPDFQIVVVDTQTGEEHLLTRGPADNFFPAWSPDGQRIVYLSRPKGGSAGATLHSTDVRGEQSVQLGTARYFVRAPSWSPDGRYLAATSEEVQIVTVDASTGQVVKQLTGHASGPSYGHSPAWDPTGGRIAFVSTADPLRGQGAIYLVDPEGRNPRVISDSRDFEPSWSPNGRWLAVESYRSDGTLPDIYVMRADGSDQRPLVRGPEIDRQPAWRRRR